MKLIYNWMNKYSFKSYVYTQNSGYIYILYHTHNSDCPTEEDNTIEVTQYLSFHLQDCFNRYNYK